MKYALILTFMLATPLAAESLCGVTEKAVVLDKLQGDWILSSGVSIEANTMSFVDTAQGVARFSVDHVGVLTHRGADYFGLHLGANGTVYDVNQVDDVLETTEAEWIADAVSTTPCGPEDLLQLSGSVSDEDRQTRLTILPYFDDQMVLIAQNELSGQVFAFITIAGLLTRE